jgi:hypothetical protein
MERARRTRAWHRKQKNRAQGPVLRVVRTKGHRGRRPRFQAIAFTREASRETLRLAVFL